jgi:polyhydroxyalkanoate synthesis regulator phasin
MKFNRWMAVPVGGLAALIIGVVAVNAATPSIGTGSNYAQVFVDKLAAILHLSPTETQNHLKQAELQTIDQMVKDGTITQAQADALKSRVNSGTGFGFGLPFRHGGAHADGTLFRDLRTAELNAVADALHMTPSDLQTQLRSGKTLSDLEQAAGVTDRAVRTAEHNAAKTVLDSAVKAGKITQAQEDAILAKIDQNGSLRGFGAGLRPGHLGEEPLPATPPAGPGSVTGA